MVVLQVIVSKQNRAKFRKRYPHIGVRKEGVRLIYLNEKTATTLRESLRAVVRRAAANNWNFKAPNFEKSGHRYDFVTYGLNETELGWIAQIGVTRGGDLVAAYDVSLGYPDAEIVEMVVDLLSNKGGLSEIEVEDLITILDSTLADPKTD